MIARFKNFSNLFFKNTQWLEKKQNTILSAALIIAVANIASSISGLIRERFLISSYFGTEASQKAYEAFQVAFQIPDLLFQLIILGALSAAFIPVFTKYKKRNQQAAFEFSSTVMNILILIFIAVALTTFIFSQPITAARTGGAFTERQIEIAANLTRLMLLAQVFFAVSSFLSGILQSFQRFIIPAVAPVLYNLGILLGVFLFRDSLGIYAAGVGVMIGAFLHMVIQLPFVFRLGYRYQFKLNFKHPGVKEIFHMIPPRFLTLGISELRNLALGFFATSIGNLSFVIIKLALRLMAIPIRLTGVPISQASLPFLAEEASQKQLKKFKTLVVQSVNQIAFFAMPASVLLLILRIPIVRLIFGADNFPWKTTVMTGRVVAIIAVSVGAQSIVHLLIRAFHALRDTTTPFYIVCVSGLTYLLLSWLFVFRFDTSVLGIAVATTTAAFIEASLFLVLLDKKVKNLFFNKNFISEQLKIMLCSFFMAVFLYLPFKIFDELIFDTSKTVELIGLTVTTSTIGVFVYIYLSALFDVHELNYFASVLNKFGRWKKPLTKSQEALIDGGSDGESI